MSAEFDVIRVAGQAGDVEEGGVGGRGAGHLVGGELLVESEHGNVASLLGEGMAFVVEIDFAHAAEETRFWWRERDGYF